MRGCHTGTQVVTQAVRLGGQQGADAKGPSLCVILQGRTGRVGDEKDSSLRRDLMMMALAIREHGRQTCLLNGKTRRDVASPLADDNYTSSPFLTATTTARQGPHAPSPTASPQPRDQSPGFPLSLNAVAPKTEISCHAFAYNSSITPPCISDKAQLLSMTGSPSFPASSSFPPITPPLSHPVKQLQIS